MKEGTKHSGTLVVDVTYILTFEQIYFSNQDLSV